ncbi:SecB chaperone [Rhodococcus sp. NBC_00294]|uniref:SecB chaperone n=1 Tax=Rhodococcus sp. NBC_00294 TaxID=2976004 RepID=UPI002E29A8CC|nr:SecB chaperone [Rhodococcus sp. NBC_00294]
MIDIDNPDLHVSARRLNARAEVRDIRLLKSAVEMEELPDGSTALAYDLNSFPEVQHSPGETFFVVQISYDLEIFSQSNNPEHEATGEQLAQRTTVAHVQFTLAALFTLSLRASDSTPSDEELEAYSSTTAQLMLYPYAREYVYDVTGRLGLPSLTLGMLKMTATSGKSSD